MSYTRTFRIWSLMLNRCRNPRADNWAYYGGRGIAVCPRWDEFAHFLADMGEAPEGLTLDRIDNELGYEKANCRWATKSEQMGNTRRSRLLTYAGRTQSMSAWARERGLVMGTVWSRLDRGMSVAEALEGIGE